MKKHAAVVSVLVSAFALLFGMQPLFLPSYAAENGVRGMPAYQASLQDMRLVDSVSAKIIAVLKKSSNPVALKNSFLQKAASIRYRYEFSQPNPKLYRLLGTVIDQVSQFNLLASSNQSYYGNLTQKGVIKDFSYDQKSGSYVATVDHLKVTLTIPPSHSLRECSSGGDCESYFNSALAEGIPYHANKIGGFSIMDKSSLKTPLDILSNLAKDKDACKWIPVQSLAHDANTFWGSLFSVGHLNIGDVAYVLDFDHFQKSDSYDNNSRRGGISSVCGLESADSIAVFFWDSYPDRYVIHTWGGHDPTLSNGGLLLDFFK